VSDVKRPYQHITGHFGDESFQSIICTSTILTAEQEQPRDRTHKVSK